MALNINGTTGISGVDGSVSAPAVTGTDSNTGITFPSADTIKFSTGGVERMQISNSGVTGTGIGAGVILQLKSVTKTDTSSLTGPQSTPQDISGLSITITPANASSKFYITGKVAMSATYATVGAIHINVNGTVVGNGDSDGSRPVGHTSGVGYADINSNNQYGLYSAAVDFLVNASDGNAHTIKLQLTQPDGARTVYINRSQTDSNGLSGPRYVSTLTVMEVAA